MGFQDLRKLEEKKHFWLVGKQKLIKNIIERHEPKALLDIGCGTGSLLKCLAQKPIKITGIDSHREAIDFCKKTLPEATFIQEDARKLSIVDKSFDFVLASDVLEHAPDDESLVKEAFRVLKTGGNILVTAPAHKSLFGKRDIDAGHQRRYSKNELKDKLRNAGFSVKYLNHYNFFLFPLMLMSRALRLN
ncbi:MAG: class I SAM-dependent methyltransferase, partial [Actinobacteria bacterium]